MAGETEKVTVKGKTQPFFSGAKTDLPEQNNAALIFPHQLFADHPAIEKGRMVFLVQDPLFFRDWKYPVYFSGTKIFLHLASMREYGKKLRSEGSKVQTIPYSNSRSFHKDLFKSLFSQGIRMVHVADPSDYILEKRIIKAAAQTGIKLSIMPSPSFMGPSIPVTELPRRGNTLSMTSFYIQQRKRFNILLDDKGKPYGGKWTFDIQNRKRLPGNVKPPSLFPLDSNISHKEILKEMKSLFPAGVQVPGTPFLYPLDHSQASRWLDIFLQERFRSFGDYEDAISTEHPFIFHSLLSSSLNIGLLTPRQVIRRSIEYASQNQVPLNSLEGFIRQILGWREFMRHTYIGKGSDMRRSNFWKHTGTIPAAFTKGQTGILPVDNVIKKVKHFGYAHHIERLMILGNFLLLCEIDPLEIYKWFMRQFIDAYDWVMVPNIFGMSQFADGGSMVTKPYICGSAYILRMSDLQRGDWCDILDSLFWRFLHIHKPIFQKIPRMQVLLSNLDRMGTERTDKLLKRADHFLEGLQ